jgi:hypothetical protein
MFLAPSPVLDCPDVCDYMAAIGKEREQRRHWQQVRN